MYTCGVAYDYESNFNLISVGAWAPCNPPVGCATAGHTYSGWQLLYNSYCHAIKYDDED